MVRVRHGARACMCTVHVPCLCRACVRSVVLRVTCRARAKADWYHYGGVANGCAMIANHEQQSTDRTNNKHKQQTTELSVLGKNRERNSENLGIPA